MITILHREGGVYRDPQKWLRHFGSQGLQQRPSFLRFPLIPRQKNKGHHTCSKLLQHDQWHWQCNSRQLRATFIDVYRLPCRAQTEHSPHAAYLHLHHFELCKELFISQLAILACRHLLRYSLSHAILPQHLLQQRCQPPQKNYLAFCHDWKGASTKKLRKKMHFHLYLYDFCMIDKKSFQGGFTRGAGCQAGGGPASVIIWSWEKSRKENWADVSGFGAVSVVEEAFKVSCLIFSNYHEESSAAKIDIREFSFLWAAAQNGKLEGKKIFGKTCQLLLSDLTN